MRRGCTSTRRTSGERHGRDRRGPDNGVGRVCRQRRPCQSPFLCVQHPRPLLVLGEGGGRARPRNRRRPQALRAQDAQRASRHHCEIDRGRSEALLQLGLRPGCLPRRGKRRVEQGGWVSYTRAPLEPADAPHIVDAAKSPRTAPCSRWR